MRLYCAGPMRGVAEFNFPAFHRAAAALRILGHEVASPAEHDLDIGFDPRKGVDPSPDVLACMMAWDVRQVLDCEAVVLLPGWESSRGTAIELVVARCAGRRVFELDEASPGMLKPLSLLDPEVSWTGRYVR